MPDSAAILGEYNVYGNSGAVSALADHLHSKAHVVHGIKDELLKGSGTTVWKGGAAEAYKGALGALPKEMDQLFDSYGKAGRVLKTYAHELHAHKLKAHQIANEIQHARDAIKTAKSDQQAAQQKYDGAKAFHEAPGLDPISKHEAGQDMTHAAGALQAANAKVNHYTGLVSGAFAAAAANRSDFVAAAQTCCGHLTDAGQLGIQNKQYHGLDALLHNVDEFLDGAGDALADIGDFLEEPVVWAGLLVIVAGMATVLTDGWAAPLFEGSVVAFDALITAKFTVDLGAALLGKKDPAILLEDALSVLGRGAGKKLLPPGTHDKLKAALEAAERTGNKGQKAYAAELKRVYLGKVLHRANDVAIEMSVKLRHDLEEILREAGCSKQSGSVPAHG